MPGEIVVAQRGMADVGREQDLPLGVPRQEALAVGERAVRQGRVDADLVLPLRQRFQGAVRKAEPPGLLVIRRPVGDQVRLLRQGEQVFLQLREGHLLVNGHAVAEDVEVARLEVHHLAAGGVLDPGVADVPLLRHRPVEHRRAGRDLADLQGNALPDHRQRAADPVARDAAADGKGLGDEAHHLFAGGHPSLSENNGRARSFSEITVTGSGQGIAKPGSSQR